MWTLILTLAGPALGQELARPQSDLKGTGWVLAADGTRYEGTLTKVQVQDGFLFKLVLRAAGTDVRHALDGAEVVEVGLAPKLRASGTTLAGALPPPEAAEPWVRFVQVRVPGAEKALFGQVRNPTFARRLELFDDPYTGRGATGGLGGMMAAGGGASWLVRRVEEAEAIRVTRESYPRQWDALFGDCPALVRPDLPRFEDLVADLYAHDRACGG